MFLNKFKVLRKINKKHIFKISMKYLLILVFVILAGCVPAEEVVQPEIIQEEFQDDPIRIVAYGDSLTEGYGLKREDAYPAQLESILLERGYNVEVFNSGYSGETTTGALERIEWVMQLNPDIVIFTTGANDAFRGVDTLIIEENMRKVIERMQKDNVTVILGGMEIVQNLGDRYVTDFEAIYPRLAEDYNLNYIPFILEGVAGNSYLNQEDEIHPTREGYSIVVEKNVLPVVLDVLN